jgi:aerobic C4-dicarboxylate transport protein
LLYRTLYLQVLFAIALGVLAGWLVPHLATSDWIKALGDGFVRLIRMAIAPIIFCTVVSGIAHIQDARKVGRVGVKALLYFEVVSSLALAIGLAVGNLFPVGHGLAAKADAAAVADYARQAAAQKSVDFVLNIIPESVVGAFAKGDILQVLLFAVLFGFSLMALGKRGEKLRDIIDEASQAIFGLIVIFYATAALFVFGVLGLVAHHVGFSIFRFVGYIKDELLLVLGTSSSESALPQLMRKLEALGCSKSVVGLVVPTGYSFNLDGTNIYMTLATMFISQALGVHLDLEQQLIILTLAMLTSKGASGVTGAGFITLAATLAVINPALVPGMAIVFSIDKFMSEVRALTNVIGNGVATLFVSWWEGELDRSQLRSRLQRGACSRGVPAATE